MKGGGHAAVVTQRESLINSRELYLIIEVTSRDTSMVRSRAADILETAIVEGIKVDDTCAQ